MSSFYDSESDSSDSEADEQLLNVQNLSLGGQLRSLPQQSLAIDPDTLRKSFLLVNSRDRNIDHEPLFRFAVKMSPAASFFQQTPIYANNPTLPQNGMQRMQGATGFPNPRYDPSRGNGPIEGFDSILVLGDDIGCYCNSAYKNIVSFSCKNGIFPKYPFMGDTKYEVYVTLDDLPNENVDGTNQILNRINTLLIPQDSAQSRNAYYPLVEPNRFRIEMNNLQKVMVTVKFPLYLAPATPIDVYDVMGLAVLPPPQGGSSYALRLTFQDPQVCRYLEKNMTLLSFGRGFGLADPGMNLFFNGTVWNPSLSPPPFYQVVDLHPEENCATIALPPELTPTFARQFPAHAPRDLTLLAGGPAGGLGGGPPGKNRVLNESLQYTLVFEIVSREKRLIYTND